MGRNFALPGAIECVYRLPSKVPRGPHTFRDALPFMYLVSNWTTPFSDCFNGNKIPYKLREFLIL